MNHVGAHACQYQMIFDALTHHNVGFIVYFDNKKLMTDRQKLLACLVGVCLLSNINRSARGWRRQIQHSVWRH